MPRQASARLVGSQPVCFSANDYAGFWRRVAVELVDVSAIAVLIVAVTVIVLRAAPSDGPDIRVLLLCWAATIYWYFVILKHSRLHNRRLPAGSCLDRRCPR